MFWVRTSDLSLNVTRRSFPLLLYCQISCRLETRYKRCSHRSSPPENITNHQVFTSFYSCLFLFLFTVIQSRFNVSSNLDPRNQPPWLQNWFSFLSCLHERWSLFLAPGIFFRALYIHLFLVIPVSIIRFSNIIVSINTSFILLGAYAIFLDRPHRQKRPWICARLYLNEYHHKIWSSL